MNTHDLYCTIDQDPMYYSGQKKKVYNGPGVANTFFL